MKLPRNSLNYRGSESFPAVNTPGAGTAAGEGERYLLGTLLGLFLCAPCSILHNTHSQCVSLSPSGSYSKLSNLRRGLWETSFCSQVRKREVWVTWREICYLQLASEVGGCLVRLSP